MRSRARHSGPTRRASLLACVVVASVATASCSLLVPHAAKEGGIGATCAADADCHASSCKAGICVMPCSADADCPAPSICAVGECHLPLRVAAIFSGVASGQEGWTLSHKLALDSVASRLGYLRFDDKPYLFTEQARSSAVIREQVDLYATRGADVVIVTSASQRDDVLARADAHPATKFLTCGGFKPNDRNVGSFFARYEQAWYVAGRFAARKAQKRIGLISSIPASGEVRFINAFVRGARSVNPTVTVELRWLGFWKDLAEAPRYDDEIGGKRYKMYREELLTAQLIKSGCEVIAHQTDTQRSVSFVQRLKTELGDKIPPVFTLATDIQDGCRVDGKADGAWQDTCLGVVYWNWAALYLPLLERMHRGTWAPQNVITTLEADPTTSAVGFDLSPQTSVTGIFSEDLRAAILEVARAGPAGVFTGPYDVTGQRDRDRDGVYDAVQHVEAAEVLTPQEESSMCWFVKGLVERADSGDPTTERDACVPDGKVGSDGRKVCSIASDVVEFLLQYPFIDPDNTMNCALNP